MNGQFRGPWQPFRPQSSESQKQFQSQMSYNSAPQLPFNQVLPRNTADLHFNFVRSADSNAVPPYCNYPNIHPGVAQQNVMPPFSTQRNTIFPPCHMPPSFWQPPEQSDFIWRPALDPSVTSTTALACIGYQGMGQPSSDFRAPAAMEIRNVSSAATGNLQDLDNERSTDKLLVAQFLSKIGKMKDDTKNTTKKKPDSDSNKRLKISEARELYQKARCLLGTLEHYMHESQANVDVHSIKEELQSILLVLSDPFVVADLKLKIKRRRKKRKRQSFAKRKYYEMKTLQIKKIKEENMELVCWQEKQKIKLEQQLREDEMQRQLDDALLEVQREQTNVVKSLEIINAISKLRKVRLNSLKDKIADIPSSFNTQDFDNAVKNIKEKLSSHCAACSRKIASLKLFIEAEQKEARLVLERKKKKKLLEYRKAWEKERTLVLFGDKDEKSAFDPLWPVQQLHQQSSLHFRSYVESRHHWDQFLHDKGSVIPVQWVEPSEPSSAEWNKYKVVNLGRKSGM